MRPLCFMLSLLIPLPAYPTVRTEPQSDIGHNRGKKKGMSDLQDSESSESEVAPTSVGSTAEERAAPPERADPPTREPESEADAANIELNDPFAHMSPAELEQWRRAEDRFLGTGM